MKLPGVIVLVALSAILLYAVGIEVVEAPSRVKAPPGVTLVSFGDLTATKLPALGHGQHGAFLAGVPPTIRRLENQRVIIQGFMIPTLMDGSRVREFLLVRSQASCCFGLPPQLTDVLAVRMTGKPVEVLMDRPVNVIGTWHVQEQWAGDFVGSLFQLDGESVGSGSSLPPLKLARTPQSMGLE
jgi:hypothetical protein